METQDIQAPSFSEQVNQDADALGATLATHLAPAHADAIAGLAKEEPVVFSQVMALVHSFRKSKRKP